MARARRTGWTLAAAAAAAGPWTDPRAAGRAHDQLKHLLRPAGLHAPAAAKVIELTEIDSSRQRATLAWARQTNPRSRTQVPDWSYTSEVDVAHRSHRGGRRARLRPGHPDPPDAEVLAALGIERVDLGIPAQRTRGRSDSAADSSTSALSTPPVQAPVTTRHLLVRSSPRCSPAADRAPALVS
ncbi:hypothetical protein M3B11_04820 [Brevibacterium sp. p3-SID960]|uniref:hypothetical protein n=1 Tax=Brevibacterium sp. p3-SID960 TaxID=2916063 RepID=UPI0021A75901|nr:hypothetical protein [Brevibacterium sp. p3-SID960]MCT1690283.1 hypothetical protein [Brevibacterium sp. p3-SID960]